MLVEQRGHPVGSTLVSQLVKRTPRWVTVLATPRLRAMRELRKLPLERHACVAELALELRGLIL